MSRLARCTRTRLASLAILVAPAALTLAMACGDGTLAPITAAPSRLAVEAQQQRGATPAMVPFRLVVRNGQSVGAFDGRCGPFPFLTVSISATGTGAHLGKTTIVQSHCQNVLDPSGAFFDGQFTDTGADGSSVVGTYAGVLVPTADPTEFVIDGTFAITGGSGRHHGANGSGLAIGTFNAATNASQLELVGQMSSVGSGKGR